MQGLMRTNAETLLRGRGRYETLHAGDRRLTLVVTELGHGTRVSVYLD